MTKHHLQESYKHITPEQIAYVEKHDLRDALDEMSNGYDVWKKSDWEYFFELFEEYIDVDASITFTIDEE